MSDAEFKLPFNPAPLIAGVLLIAFAALTYFYSSEIHPAASAALIFIGVIFMLQLKRVVLLPGEIRFHSVVFKTQKHIQKKDIQAIFWGSFVAENNSPHLKALPIKIRLYSKQNLIVSTSRLGQSDLQKLETYLKTFYSDKLQG